MIAKPIIYVLNNHHELLYLWQKLKFKNIKILHLDAHCDMHGSLVDRKNKCNYILPSLKNLDCGNFISFAVREGIVKEIRWLHDKYGGRNNDITHVKYESDLSSGFFLIKNRYSPQKKYPLGYAELFINNNFEIEEGEHLDIDWDFFALKSKTIQQREKSIDLFLNSHFSRIPRYSYICYSPDYVPETKKEFDDFVLHLKDKFEANVLNYSNCCSVLPTQKKFLIRFKNRLKWRVRKHLFFPFKKKLNKIGIY